MNKKKSKQVLIKYHCQQTYHVFIIIQNIFILSIWALLILADIYKMDLVSRDSSPRLALFAPFMIFISLIDLLFNQISHLFNIVQHSSHAKYVSMDDIAIFKSTQTITVRSSSVNVVFKFFLNISIISLILLFITLC